MRLLYTQFLYYLIEPILFYKQYILDLKSMVNLSVCCGELLPLEVSDVNGIADPYFFTYDYRILFDK